MDRYFLEPYGRYGTGSYAMFDRVANATSPIGVIYDPEIAARICALLNADEAARQQADRRVQNVGQQIAEAQEKLDSRTA